ncbi:hypothetical protein [Caulobacter zeae]|uniref:hypothetical protein n=1 Tax=Caulobacter zeae TaxID=2055137 RepID=UPI00196AB98B|nr:hypothetical protein [Caulobacter zeae]
MGLWTGPAEGRHERPDPDRAFAEMVPRLSPAGRAFPRALAGGMVRRAIQGRPPMAKKPSTSDGEWLSALALALVETGFRNSRLEELHAGVSPDTAVGDYSDVKVVTPYGEIAWSRVSRLDDEEMKALMIEVVDRVYTMLTHPEPFMRLAGGPALEQAAA